MGKRQTWAVLVIFFALGAFQSSLLYLFSGRDNYAFVESYVIPNVLLWLLVVVSMPFALLCAIVVRQVIPSCLPGLYWFGLVGIAFGCGGLLSLLVTGVPPISGAFCQIGTSGESD